MSEEILKENETVNEAEEETVEAEETAETTQEDAAKTESETEAFPEAEEDKAEEESCEEEADQETSEEDDKDSEKESKKLFKKKDKKDAKDTKIEELTDQVKRQMAEFENFRKRTEKEKSSMYEMGAKSVIEKILPVIDNFERGLATVPEGENNAFYEGMQLVYKQLSTELENIGVKPIEAVGQVFDPNLHNAVMQVASEEYESGVVAQELQKGYTYRDSVVRYSMVAVVE